MPPEVRRQLAAELLAAVASIMGVLEGMLLRSSGLVSKAPAHEVVSLLDVIQELHECAAAVRALKPLVEGVAGGIAGEGEGTFADVVLRAQALVDEHAKRSGVPDYRIVLMRVGEENGVDAAS